MSLSSSHIPETDLNWVLTYPEFITKIEYITAEFVKERPFGVFHCAVLWVYVKPDTAGLEP